MLPKIAIMTLSALFAFVAAFAANSSVAQADGKAIFLDNKCSQCHGISAIGIKATEKSTEKPVPSDLSGVGLRHDAAWISKFMLKKEKLDGHKHKKKFRGPAADLDVLSKWLGTLKSATK